ncbi:MAG: hypothetical protein ACFE8N_04015 [Promethearchaeota archaeon]
MKTNNSEDILQCAICRNGIEDRTQIYQAKAFLSIVCSDPQAEFSPEDVEVISGLLTAFEGYFGILERSKISLLDVLKETLEEVENIDVDQINMHKPLYTS